MEYAEWGNLVLDRQKWRCRLPPIQKEFTFKPTRTEGGKIRKRNVNYFEFLNSLVHRGCFVLPNSMFNKS